MSVSRKEFLSSVVFMRGKETQCPQGTAFERGPGPYSDLVACQPTRARLLSRAEALFVFKLTPSVLLRVRILLLTYFSCRRPCHWPCYWPFHRRMGEGTWGGATGLWDGGRQRRARYERRQRDGRRGSDFRLQLGAPDRGHVGRGLGSKVGLGPRLPSDVNSSHINRHSILCVLVLDVCITYSASMCLICDPNLPFLNLVTFWSLFLLRTQGEHPKSRWRHCDFKLMSFSSKSWRCLQRILEG